MHLLCYYLRIDSMDRQAFIKWLQRRITHGESRAAVARELGVSREMIRHWLDGRSGVSGPVLLLAERLHKDSLTAQVRDARVRSISEKV